MQYNSYYKSPLGNILISADDIGITELYFTNNKNTTKYTINQHIKDAINWLDIYFEGNPPNFLPQFHLIGTPFQIKIWQRLLNIPYGKTISYKEIAEEISKTMSAQAIGRAVGENKIGIMIPCHRVVGKNGNPTGYAWGIEKKIKLLNLEAKINFKTY